MTVPCPAPTILAGIKGLDNTSQVLKAVRHDLHLCTISRCSRGGFHSTLTLTRLAELYHLRLLLFGHGLPYLIGVMEAFHCPHHFSADHAALPNGLPTRATRPSSSAATFSGILSRHRARVGNCAFGNRRTGLLGVDGQCQMRDHIANQGGEP